MRNGIFINNGNKYWINNDKLHREDGPACEYADGDKYWFQNGKRHRLDGPSFEGCCGYKEWHYQDQKIECSSQDEFEKLIKLKAFW